ncbi:MAG TPA: Stf0 family sulfotransferase [Stellaceae bacterium]|nr:Stf0 family sulfotransferase [Stellaceae bacterium]
MRYTETQLTGELLDQPEFIGEPIKIFICSTPRSGSYMLCRYMVNAGLGVPHEYFNPVIMRQIAPRLGLGDSVAALQWRHKSLRDRLPFRTPDRVAEERFLAAYIDRLLPRRCQHGVFAAKIHFDQYFSVLDNPTGRRLLDGALFIHQFREDLLRQAVSRNFSYVTGRWGDDDTVTTAPMPQGDLLDPIGIDRELQTLADEDREWRVLLARNGLSPMSVSYEQLCNDPSAFVAAIAVRLGIDPATLRHGYSEPIVPSRDDDPALPGKREVIERYLAAKRVLHGPATPKPTQPVAPTTTAAKAAE